MTNGMFCGQNQQDTTFWGQVYMTYFALPHLRRTSGKILVIASAASWLPYPREIIYNVSVIFQLLLSKIPYSNYARF
jgi:short-subunit dehydrogenase